MQIRKPDPGPTNLTRVPEIDQHHLAAKVLQGNGAINRLQGEITAHVFADVGGSARMGIAPASEYLSIRLKQHKSLDRSVLRFSFFFLTFVGRYLISHHKRLRH